MVLLSMIQGNGFMVNCFLLYIEYSNIVEKLKTNGKLWYKNLCYDMKGMFFWCFCRITRNMKLSINKTLTFRMMITAETIILWNTNIANIFCRVCMKTFIAHFIHCGFSSNLFYGILRIVWLKNYISFYDFLNKKKENMK